MPVELDMEPNKLKDLSTVLGEHAELMASIQSLTGAAQVSAIMATIDAIIRGDLNEAARQARVITRGVSKQAADALPRVKAALTVMEAFGEETEDGLAELRALVAFGEAVASSAKESAQ